MAYIEYADKYLPGEVYRSTYGGADTNPFLRVYAKARKGVKFTPQEEDTMSGGIVPEVPQPAEGSRFPLPRSY